MKKSRPTDSKRKVTPQFTHTHTDIHTRASARANKDELTKRQIGIFFNDFFFPQLTKSSVTTEIDTDVKRKEKIVHNN